jgi:hypothetical protein
MSKPVVFTYSRTCRKCKQPKPLQGGRSVCVRGGQKFFECADCKPKVVTNGEAAPV